MKNFLPFLISANQSAFIPGRLINENSLLAHEMVRNFNTSTGNHMCMKVDLQKAYDRINRGFIKHMMIQMGFPIKFCDLVYERINTATFSIIINGKPIGFIKSNRGLRQGDPISPYLFTIAMEYFTILMDLNLINQRISPINRVKPIVSHLIYADNLMIFIKANANSAHSMKEIFDNMYSNAGLMINECKSKIYFNSKC